MSGCPDMVGPCQRQYQWYDEKGKKCKVAAPQYIDYVMTFTQKTINDECIFPSKYVRLPPGNEFPTSFESIVKKIHRLLFHVIAHLYCAHFKEIWMLALHSHLNCLFAHMVLFNERFKLIEDKETEILNDLVVALKLHPDNLMPVEAVVSEDIGSTIIYGEEATPSDQFGGFDPTTMAALERVPLTPAAGNGLQGITAAVTQVNYPDAVLSGVGGVVGEDTKLQQQ